MIVQSVMQNFSFLLNSLYKKTNKNFLVFNGALSCLYDNHAIVGYLRVIAVFTCVRLCGLVDDKVLSTNRVLF